MTGFRRPWAFWLGVAAVTAGVGCHLPMYLDAKSNHYLLAGMPMDGLMLFGMGLLVVGYAAVIYGLAPTFSRPTREAAALEFEALDESRLTAAHIRLMVAMTVAVAIDTQKPFTFTFILPGVANEYDLRSPAHAAPGHWPVAKAVHLVNIAPSVGLDFHQDAFRYGMSYDPQAMMGGGV